MYKSLSSFFQQKSYKDPDTATNTCTTDTSYNNKSGNGKFTRKQDVSLIEKKKKPAPTDANILCYLTPKNHDDSAKMILSRIKDACIESGSDTIISEPTQQICAKTTPGKFSFKGYEPYRPLEKRPSIEKRTIDQEEQNKFITPFKTAKQSADKSFTQKDQSKSLLDKSGIKSSRIREVQREQEKQINEKSRVGSGNFQKQLKKLKNQCEHYSNLLEVANKERIENQALVKSLNALVNDLKQKNTSLTKTSEELSREILQLTTKLNMANQEKEKLSKENSFINEEKAKLMGDVNYFKDTVKELNERIEVMLEAEKEIKVAQSQKSMNFISTNPSHSRRFNSILVSPCSALEQRPQIAEEESRLVHELREELKYCQVEISMLKRVKMDINKKNDEFIKLQRQNKILKNQLFDMKNDDYFDEPAPSRGLVRSSARLYNENKQKEGNRNNFQIGLKRGARASDQRSDSLSSDTLSLNLSISPEKNRHNNSSTHRV